MTAGKSKTTPPLCAEGEIYNFDTASFWTKWLRDIQAEQKPEGQVPVVCPGAHYEPWPAWQSTYPQLVWYVHQYYGDQRVLETHYDGLKKLVEYLGTLAKDDVITAGLGDHMEPHADGTASY